ncbi:MAG TPA: HEAT repeat domain-containing protein [Rhodothermales bacterium]
MKSLICTFVLCAITSIGLSASAQGNRMEEVPQAADSVDLATLEVKLASYGMTVGELLASDDDEHRVAALRHIIRDGANTKFSRTDVYQVVRIYRDHPDDDIRRMAVVALGQMNDGWAIDFLTRSTHFERTPKVLHTLIAVLDEYNAPAPIELDEGELARTDP